MTPHHLILTIVLCCVSFILGGWAWAYHESKKERKNIANLTKDEYLESQRKKLWDKINSVETLN